MFEKKMINIILIISLGLNCFIFITAGVFIYKKGGLHYIKTKLSSPIPEEAKRSPSYMRHLSLFDILPQTKGDIVFVGDSITAGVDWTKLIGDIRIRNMGIGMDYSEGVLLRLDGIIRLQPSKVFIMIGIADLNNYYVPIPKIIENCRSIITRVNQESPGTKIFFQSALPKQRYASTYVGLNDDIIRLNSELEKLCSNYDFVKYIDLHKLFRVSGNQMNPAYTYDGGHLNARGYLVWKAAVEKYVVER